MPSIIQKTLKNDKKHLRNPESFCCWWTISWKKELIWYEYRYARNESYSVTEWVVHEQHQRMGPSIPNPWWSPTKSKVPWNSFWVRKLSMYLLYWIIFVGCVSQTNIRPPRKSFPYIHIYIYPTIMLFLFQALLSRSHRTVYSHRTGMSAMVGDRTLTHLLLEWSAVTRQFGSNLRWVEVLQ